MCLKVFRMPAEHPLLLLPSLMYQQKTQRRRCCLNQSDSWLHLSARLIKRRSAPFACCSSGPDELI